MSANNKTNMANSSSQVAKPYMQTFIILSVFVTFTLLVYYSLTSKLIDQFDFRPSDLLSISLIAKSSGLGNAINNDIIRELKDIDFPSEALEFATLAKEHTLEFFVVEPCIVWQLLTKNDQKLLKRRFSIPKTAKKCETISGGQSLMSFGAFDDQVPTTAFLDQLSKRGFTSAIYKHTDQKPLHFAVKKNSTIIHVTSFTKRNNFFYIHEFSDPPFSVNKSELRFGHVVSAYDSFELDHNLVNGVKLLFPAEKRHFLFQMKYIRFLECRHELAEKWKKEYPSEAKVTQQTKETVDTMRKLMKVNSVPIFLDGGSMIGWARHCGEASMILSELITHICIFLGAVRKRC